VDSTIVLAHSDKDGAAARYNGYTYGFHPILVTCDNTSELLAIRLRPGNAGANTAADHLEVLADAIGQIPAGHRRHLSIRGDSAAASHKVLDWLTSLRRLVADRRRRSHPSRTSVPAARARWVIRRRPPRSRRCA